MAGRKQFNLLMSVVNAGLFGAGIGDLYAAFGFLRGDLQEVDVAQPRHHLA